MSYKARDLIFNASQMIFPRMSLIIIFPWNWELICFKWVPSINWNIQVVKNQYFWYRLWWWWWLMLYGHFSAHGRLNQPSELKDETLFRYAHTEIQTRVIVIQHPTVRPWRCPATTFEFFFMWDHSHKTIQISYSWAFDQYNKEPSIDPLWYTTDY